MKSVSTDSNRVVSFGEKVSYGITEIACNPMYTIFCSFLVFFYTDVIGVNAAAVGTIILISRIFDGLSDIIAGNIVEHTHAKSGSSVDSAHRHSPRHLLYRYVHSSGLWRVGQADLHFRFL